MKVTMLNSLLLVQTTGCYMSIASSYHFFNFFFHQECLKSLVSAYLV